jgi:hypothetical protein
MFGHKRHGNLLMVRFCAQAKHDREKERKEKNQIFGVSLLLLGSGMTLLPCGGSTPHISASLKFGTIQAIVKQFGQAVGCQKL